MNTDMNVLNGMNANIQASLKARDEIGSGPPMKDIDTIERQT